MMEEFLLWALGPGCQECPLQSMCKTGLQGLEAGAGGGICSCHFLGDSVKRLSDNPNYSQEKRSGLIHNLTFLFFGGGQERWGCMGQVCVGGWLQGCRSRTPCPPGAGWWLTLQPGSASWDLHLWGLQAGSAVLACRRRHTFHASSTPSPK